MTLPDHTKANVAIAEALGLDVNRIPKGGVTIRLDAYLGPVVDVTYQMYDPEIHVLATALKRYRLVAVEETEDIA